MIESAGNKPIFDKYFVIVRFDVQEHGDKQSLNTPGADKLYTELGGSGGLPFYALLDSLGKLIVNSVRPAAPGIAGGDIGHPIEPAEIDWFLLMLTQAAPAMTASEKAVLAAWLRAQKKPR